MSRDLEAPVHTASTSHSSAFPHNAAAAAAVAAASMFCCQHELLSSSNSSIQLDMQTASQFTGKLGAMTHVAVEPDLGLAYYTAGQTQPSFVCTAAAPPVTTLMMHRTWAGDQLQGIKVWGQDPFAIVLIHRLEHGLCWQYKHLWVFLSPSWYF